MKWTDTAIAALKRLWNGGVSAREIGRELGVSHDSVTSKARREGLDRRANPVTQNDLDEFAEYLSRHGDIVEASKQAGIPTSLGRMHFKRMQRDLGWQAQ